MKTENKISLMLSLVLLAWLVLACSWAGPSDSRQETYTATLVSTDETTNSIFSLTPPVGAAVRMEARVVGFSSQTNTAATYGRSCLVKNIGGTVTQVGPSALTGLAEDDLKYDCSVAVVSNALQLRVAGDVGHTVNWIAYVTLYYSP